MSIDKKGNNEGERAAQEYVDTTLRTSHYKQSEETNQTTTQNGKKASWAIWQNYVILAAIISLMFGGAENNRLNVEAERLTKKNREHAETKQAFLGFIENSKIHLQHATVINTLRKNGFPFFDWHPSLAEKMVSLAVKLNHNEALGWVVEQPRWKSILSLKLVNRVETHLVEGPKPKAIWEMTSSEKRKHFRGRNGGRNMSGTNNSAR